MTPATSLYAVGNATAGLFAGDVLEARIRVLRGARVSLTTPAATYAFAMPEGEAQVHTRIDVEAGGSLEYRPRPIIPFAGSALKQVTEFHLSEGGALRSIDTLALGRIDHGEVARFRRLDAVTGVWVGERLVLWDAIRIEPAKLPPGTLERAWDGRHALGTLIVAGAALDRWQPEREAWRELARSLANEGVRLGVSRPDPAVLIARALGPYPEMVIEALETVSALGREEGSPPVGSTALTGGVCKVATW